AAVAQYSGRRVVVSSYRCQVVIDQRLCNKLALLSVLCGALLVGCKARELQQSIGDDRRGRGIAVPEANALIVKVVPGHVVLGKSAQDVGSDLFRRLQHS